MRMSTLHEDCVAAAAIGHDGGAEADALLAPLNQAEWWLYCMM